MPRFTVQRWLVRHMVIEVWIDVLLHRIELLDCRLLQGNDRERILLLTLRLICSECVVVEKVRDVALFDSLQPLFTMVPTEGTNCSRLTLLRPIVLFNLSAHWHALPESSSLLFSHHTLHCMNAYLFFRIKLWQGVDWLPLLLSIKVGRRRSIICHLRFVWVNLLYRLWHQIPCYLSS